jgi:glucose/arabinose dehydrogenase
MAVAPNGDVLVSHPGSGRIYLLRPNASGHADVSVFASGLRNPHDLVFATLAGTTWLYVAESHQIVRYVYRSGDVVISSANPVVTGLPDSSSPDLQGNYGHQLKNIAIGADGKLYVSIASATNASNADAISDPVRCAIYQYNADGTGRRLFARGLRNAEGLAFVPGTSTLWVTVNGRDNTRVPTHRDWDGDGTDDYGKLLSAYVDNHPPEPFTRVTDGANYGWPYANPTPDSPNGLTNMPFDPDYENNRDWTRFPESSFTRISKGIQAHSAPLGFSFLQNSLVPAAYRNGAAIALHGSWNRSRKVGYKVIYFPWRTDGTPGDEMDLVRGWLNDSTQGVWGRPVDVVPDATGGLLISDDVSGTIYRLTSTEPTASGPQVSELFLVDTRTGAKIGRLSSGGTIDLRSYPKISVVAEMSPTGTGSIWFSGSGTAAGGGESVAFSRTESVAPYAIAGDSGGSSIHAWNPPTGNGTYQLRVTPYSGSNRTGTAGTPRDVSFSVVNGPQMIVRLSLVNADTNVPLAGFHPIPPGSTIRLSQLPTRNLTIQAFTSPATVGSVRLALTGPVSLTRVESVAPYVIAGDGGGDLYPMQAPLSPGSYSITATPYSAAAGGGSVGTATTIAFRVEN